MRRSDPPAFYHPQPLELPTDLFSGRPRLLSSALCVTTKLSQTHTGGCLHRPVRVPLHRLPSENAFRVPTEPIATHSTLSPQ